MKLIFKKAISLMLVAGLMLGSSFLQAGIWDSKIFPWNWGAPDPAAAINFEEGNRVGVGAYVQSGHKDNFSVLWETPSIVNKATIIKYINANQEEMAKKLYREIPRPNRVVGYHYDGPVNEVEVYSYFSKNLSDFYELMREMLKNNQGALQAFEDKVKADEVRVRQDLQDERERAREAHGRALNQGREVLEVWQKAKANAQPYGMMTLLVIGGIFGIKNFAEYCKKKALVPPFVSETNDESYLTSLLNWWNGTGQVAGESSERKLKWSKQQKEIINNLRIEYLNDLDLNLPAQHYLFYGPTGTGKTSLARQLAKDAGSLYYVIKGSSFLDKGGARHFRQLMSRVRSSGSRPIIFIDEADCIIGHGASYTGMAKAVFDDILSELGDTNNRACSFIFTTNIPDNIDKRIRDRLTPVYFPRPDLEARIKIIKSSLEFYFQENLGGLDDEIEFSQLTTDMFKLAAEKTVAWSPRDYDRCIEALRRKLVRKELYECTAKDFFDAIQEYIDTKLCLSKEAQELKNLYQ